MEGTLKCGTVLQSQSGQSYTINSLLGAGGQGEVYDVSKNGQHYALKWYFKHTATEQQKEILSNLLDKGSPSELFLWPKDLVEDVSQELFGYIMPLRPKEYKNIVDLMKRRTEPTFLSLCHACFNLAKGYSLLHIEGYQYRDISFGNVFFNPNNGDILICDNDNVVPNGIKSGGVLGTPRFMAPEIVRGEARPSRNTDKFSLAVLLFYMLMINHPLEGALEANIKCMDTPALNKLYGTNPVFIYDPRDTSNRPVPGWQDNAIIYWNIYPKYIQDLFIQSFTVGLREPEKRVTEGEWLAAFANLIGGLVTCPHCGNEVFYDSEKEVKCWNCGKTVNMPTKLVIGKTKIPITANKKIYSHYIHRDYDIDTVVAEFVINPKNPNIWGVRNKTATNWTYIKADNTQMIVENGKAATIAPNTKIDFGNNVIGYFE